MYSVTCNTIVLYTAMRPPYPPVVTNVMTTSSSVTITWMVPRIAYDQENYSLEYGKMSMAALGSMNRTGNTNLNTIDDIFSVTINRLEPFTMYYFILRASNSNGSISSAQMTFETDEAGMLLCTIMYVHKYIN